MTVSDDKFTRQTLLEVHSLTPSLFTLRTTRDAGFRFRAGQFVRLGVERADGSVVWRAYSLVSAPHDEHLEFFSIVVPGGEFTDLWLLGSGTGIAPFLSILQDFEVWQRFARIVLVYSARTCAELAYQPLIRSFAELEHLAEFADKLTYLPVVTREQAPGCLNARITELLDNGELERAAGLELTPEHSRVMICGNPQMIDDIRQRLKARGLNLSLTRRPGQVAVENYW
ncbi:MAG: ferredoxin--NADP(+) reductase [Gammaproteobacteria bacterium HGW-Gammaproteobacteria-12]|nr:MAG: ferredoxin--NADP(+) reductase [Gammaproteobacteria bacterium HGW-Gammaproteobacteria-12]